MRILDARGTVVDMLNRLARYQPVVALIKKHGPSSILEIGSGSIGIGEFCPQAFTGVDVSFVGATAPWMTPVTASATELPFPDNAFDLVICMDMLEHVDPRMRVRVIEEAIRVARDQCIIGFPSGRPAHDADAELHRWCRKKGVPVPAWLEEHVRTSFPEEDEVTALIRSRAGVSCICVGNENLGVHGVILRMEMHPRRWIRTAAFLLRYRLQALSGFILSLLSVPPYYRKLLIVRKKGSTV